MSSRTRAAVALTTMVLAAAVAPPAVPAAVVDCPGSISFGPGGAWNISAREMSCRTARRYIRGSCATSGRCHFRRPRRAGFRCGKVGNYYDGVIYRCARGGQAFRFSFGV